MLGWFRKGCLQAVAAPWLSSGWSRHHRVTLPKHGMPGLARASAAVVVVLGPCVHGPSIVWVFVQLSLLAGRLGSATHEPEEPALAKHEQQGRTVQL